MFTSLPEHRRLNPLLSAVRERSPDDVQSTFQFFFRLTYNGTPTHLSEVLQVCRVVELWKDVIDELTRNPVTFHALHLDRAHSFCIENRGVGIVYVQREKAEDEAFNKWSNLCISLNLSDLHHHIQRAIDVYHQSYDYQLEQTVGRWSSAMAWLGMAATGFWWWLRA